MPRTASIQRKTNETNVDLTLNLDGGSYRNQTGVGLLDHMLDHIARHGGFGLNVKASGDTHIDGHHSVEDVGIVLGQAVNEALGDKIGIERYGDAAVPMDEALARVAIDLSGRSALVFKVDFRQFGADPAAIGHFDVQLIQEFFIAVANNGRMNLHIEVPWGENNHHIAEAIFKAFGRALRRAVTITGDEVPSTKGML